MHPIIPTVCAIATFIVITDHIRIVAAEGAPLKGIESSRVKRQGNLYTSEYDSVDVDSILNSERLLKSYIRCLLEKGPCTKEGRELKKYLPDALQTDCSKCTEVQKKQGGKVLTFILRNYRDDWNALVLKYDPEGIFRRKYGFEGDEEDDDEEGDEARKR